MKKKHRKKKAASGRRKPISFEPLIMGQIAKGQCDDIINEQIKKFEIARDSFIRNQGYVL